MHSEFIPNFLFSNPLLLLIIIPYSNSLVYIILN